MKKIAVLILALALILSAVPSVAEDPDPIVGIWYILLNVADGPQNPLYQDYTCLMMILNFEPDGRIWYSEQDYLPADSVAVDPYISGEWSRTEEGYNTKLMSLGEGPAYLKDGLLYVKVMPNVYYVMHRMTPANWYSDILADTVVQLREGTP